MSVCGLIFPHQLFSDHPVLRRHPARVVLIEDTLFFGDSVYPARLHKQKLAFHRATMAAYASELERKVVEHEWLRYHGPESAIVELCRRLSNEGVEQLLVVEVHDFILQRRLESACSDSGLELETLTTPMFLNTPDDNRGYRNQRKRWYMADFYQWQRRRFELLLDKEGEPEGGQWSFDEDNRRKLPKGRIAELPALPQVNRTERVREAIDSVERDFPDNPGSLDNWYYPTTSEAADRWLTRFLEERFAEFGPFEDAIVEGQSWLFHSVLTPMLNVGLLTPDQIVRAAMTAAGRSAGTLCTTEADPSSGNAKGSSANPRADEAIPLNSLEGFLRQIIGWREFMRATYEDLGVAMRTTNHWNHTRKLPDSFYSATTGVRPVDDVIARVQETGYCHHIERLMVLGGFMFLCEIDPDDVYRWFMEMFIDSYDWVMVPNVYAMSQHADGGAITTKPYFSGSNYVLKMSNYGKGDWTAIWDGLFWRWIHKQQDALAGNPRWAMMVRNVERMDRKKLEGHLETAERYLASLG